MAKKAILFLSGFLLFFCFAFVKAEDTQSTTTTPEITPISTLYEEATSTDMLISPSPIITETKQEDTQLIKDQEFLKTCSLSKCRIPIPTLKEPNNKNFYSGQEIFLTGLTWNNTIISIYVDDIYYGEAIVKNDENSNTANFYIELENLSTGKHNWSVIAWSLNKKDRSFVSAKNSFTILENKNIISEPKQIEATPTSTSSISESRETIDIVSQELDVPVSVDFNESTSSVNVTSSEEKNILVVDSELKSDEKEQAPVKEQVRESETSSITEEIQSATPSEEIREEIRKDIVVDEASKNKRKIGIVLLSALVIFSGLSVIFLRKKK